MPNRILFYLLPAVTMSLGWGLRGTIGGGPVGAMIPGAMVTLSLCYLLGWNSRVAIAAALGTVGVGLGGQMTYGQTIGFVRDPETQMWGLLGLTTKGAVWGLSGGVLVGLGFTQSLYKTREILAGLALMLVGTVAGHLLVDAPKLAYFSNRLDKPREEIWFGLTLGAIALLGYLLFLQREKISAAFAFIGMIGGGAGFGGGGLFIWLGGVLDESFRGWPWWKMMEFHFGLLYGLALGIVCYHHRQRLADLDSAETPVHGWLIDAPWPKLAVAGLALVVAGLWLQFTIPHRAMFSIVGSALIALTLFAPPLGWHVALSMTTSGFVRDWLYKVVQPGIGSAAAGWLSVLTLTVPIVLVVALAQSKGTLTSKAALLGLTLVATAFGLVKLGLPELAMGMHLFVPLTFVVEAIMVTALLLCSNPLKDHYRTE